MGYGPALIKEFEMSRLSEKVRRSLGGEILGYEKTSNYAKISSENASKFMGFRMFFPVSQYLSVPVSKLSFEYMTETIS